MLRSKRYRLCDIAFKFLKIEPVSSWSINIVEAVVIFASISLLRQLFWFKKLSKKLLLESPKWREIISEGYFSRANVLESLLLLALYLCRLPFCWLRAVICRCVNKNFWLFKNLKLTCRGGHTLHPSTGVGHRGEHKTRDQRSNVLQLMKTYLFHHFFVSFFLPKVSKVSWLLGTI